MLGKLIRATASERANWNVQQNTLSERHVDFFGQQR